MNAPVRGLPSALISLPGRSESRHSANWPSRQSTPLRWQFGDSLSLLFWLLPALLMAWTTAAGSGTDDTLRDLYFAAQISEARGWPLAGPVIGNISHLGPIWYYLLAPAYAWGGATAALAWAGALGGLHFPLAFLLGREVGGRRLGWIAAIAYLVPGWLLWAPLNPTHTALQPALLLALVLLALAYRRSPGPMGAAWLGLGASLLLHAHPSNLLLAGLVLATAFWPRRWTLGLLTAPALAAVAAALPWLPLLWMPPSAESDAVQGLGEYARHNLFVPLEDRLWPLWRGSLFEGMRLVYAYWLRLDGVALGLALGLQLSGFILGAVGLLMGLRSAQVRTLLLALLVAALSHSVLVLWLRPITPSWMAYAHCVLLASLVSLGWHQLWSRWHLARWLLSAVWLAAGLSWIAVLLFIREPPAQVLWPSYPPDSPGLMSVSSVPTGQIEVYPDDRPLQALEALSAQLCRPLVVYGQLAGALDASFGLGLRRHCGGVEHLRLGGPPQPDLEAILGLNRRALASLGLSRAGDPSDRSLRLFPVAEVWTAAQPLQITGAGRFPRRPLPPPTQLNYRLSATARADAVIAVSWRALGYFPFTAPRASANGRTVEPHYSDHELALFRCDNCDGKEPVVWSLQGDSAPDWIDVLAFFPH